MSGSEMITEITATFPARGIPISNQSPCSNGCNMNALFPETTCAWCGEKFTFCRALHRYKRHRGKKLYLFDRWTCMQAFDRARPDLGEKRVEDCRKRLDYLLSLDGIPREEWSDPKIRDNGIALSSMIMRAEAKLNTAIAKFIKTEEEKERRRCLNIK